MGPFLGHFSMGKDYLVRFLHACPRLTLVKHLAIAAQALLTVAAVYGAGQHKKDLVPTDLPMVVKFQWLGTWLALLSGGVGKIAVVALILQIQGSAATRPKRYFLHFIWASAMLIDIMQVIMLINQCSPPWKLWYSKTPGNCHLVKVASNTGEFTGAWSAFCDIALAIYPATMFWDLSLNTKKKIGLTLLMGCGVVAGLTAAVKTGFVKLSTSTVDPTYVSTPLKILLYSETWLIIILGSIPTLKPLFDRIYVATARATSRLSSASRSDSGGITMNEKGELRVASRELISPRLHASPSRPSRIGIFSTMRSKSQEPLRENEADQGVIYVTTDFGLESQQNRISHSSSEAPTIRVDAPVYPQGFITTVRS